MGFLERFFPDRYIDSVFDLPTDELIKKNITALIFDIDNTLAPYDVPVADAGVKDFFLELERLGFSICVLSNNNEKRVSLFCKDLGLPYVYKAGKPRLKGISKSLLNLNASAENASIIGDQIFTDIWCGNRKGLYTILVKPLSVKDEWITKIKRGLERRVINIYLEKTHKNEVS